MVFSFPSSVLLVVVFLLLQQKHLGVASQACSSFTVDGGGGVWSVAHVAPKNAVDRSSVLGPFCGEYYVGVVLSNITLTCRDYCSVISCLGSNTTINSFSANAVTLNVGEFSDAVGLIGTTALGNVTFNRVYVTNLNVSYKVGTTFNSISAAAAWIGQIYGRVSVGYGMFTINVAWSPPPLPSAITVASSDQGFFVGDMRENASLVLGGDVNCTLKRVLVVILSADGNNNNGFSMFPSSPTIDLACTVFVARQGVRVFPRFPTTALPTTLYTVIYGDQELLQQIQVPPPQRLKARFNTLVTRLGLDPLYFTYSTTAPTFLVPR